ncbi:cytochrome P450 [Mucidula mucida]|nr:cytochrome P450 [Mucidula mucida]
MHKLSALYYVGVPLLLLTALYIKNKKRDSISISLVNGPATTCSDNILGNLGEYYRQGVGEHEFKWQKEYGSVYRIKGVFREDRLFVSDPRALRHIYQSAGTRFLKPTARREFSRMAFGRGIAYALFEDHKRHRKLLGPAFGQIESRGMVPVFLEKADQLCQIWTDILLKQESNTANIEVTNWLSRGAIDVIGEAAFKYQFNSLTQEDNVLAKAYDSMLVNTFGLPTRGGVLAQQVLVHLPASVFWLLERLPSRSLKGLKDVARVGDMVAHQLIKERRQALEQALESPPRDVLSLLLQANAETSAEGRLTDEELSANMRTIIAAGHETTASSMAFLFYELSKHPEVQQTLRLEIMETMAKVKTQGQCDVSVKDLDGMAYTLAVIKESMRIHPVIYGPFLEPADNDVIPLAKPIRTLDGRTVTEIPVGKGQLIHASIAGYNRLEDLWGEDPDQFKPERWLGHVSGFNPASSPFGIYSGLANFVGGTQSCLGWRFAVLETQVFLVKIIQSFSLKYPKDAPDIVRAPSGVMAPVLPGQRGKKLVLEVVSVS